MTTDRYLIGVDIGTTSTKAVLFTLAGEAVQQALIEYPLYSPTPATAEQDPNEIFLAVLKTIQQVVQAIGAKPGEIVGLSFSSAMHSLILMDKDDRPLTRSITWADNRSAAWAQSLKQSGQGHEIYLRTGTPIHPMSPLVKLLWLRQDQLDLFQQAARFISIKEYVFFRLTRRYVVDYSIASATGLLNLNRLEWDSEALDIAGVRPAQLSELVPTTYLLKPIQTDFAAIMGIAPETPIVMGASDGVLSNLGVGAIEPGVFATTIGTSGAIRAVIDRPVTDPQERLFCYPLTKQHWVIGGAVNNGGIALRWVRDQFADAEVALATQRGQDPYHLIMQQAEAVSPGADGLLFHPYLLGERSPLWNANARGSFFGLTLNHTRAHITRAVLEGVLFNLLIVLQALEDFAGTAKRIQATGGFARSALWRQMMADIFDREITIPAQHESSCLGAAIVGLYALGFIDSLTLSTAMIGETLRHQPIAAHTAQYQKLFPVYQRLLDCFQREYETIAQLQSYLKAK
ncbi:gluconokinase [Leptolyngbya sp. GB1-A1]|uniref:gluconokinase n=1 Tax=Leptolyngbya sp. GB1-A1 TaxID=2933908 RepID=UPI003299F241